MFANCPKAPYDSAYIMHTNDCQGWLDTWECVILETGPAKRWLICLLENARKTAGLIAETCEVHVNLSYLSSVFEFIATASSFLSS